MRFVVFMIPAVYQGEQGRKVGADFAPPADAVERMMKYNEELAKAGVLVALDGLHPPSTGARVSFKGGKATVTDGPFTEAKEVVGGYWMINVKSRDEAIAWARRVPADEGDVVEVRQVFEVEEFPPDVQKAAQNPTVEAAIEKHQQK